MREYIAKRVLLMVPTAILATLIVFALMKVAPGDPATAILADLDVISQEAEAEAEARIRAQLGLDKPLPIQYLNWLGAVARFEFGDSIWQYRPVRDIVLERLPRTMELGALIVLLTALWAVPGGIISAVQHNKMTDQVLRVLSISGLSIPNVWLGTLVIFALAAYFNWLPSLRWHSPMDDLGANLSHIIFPAIIVSSSTGASILRMTRSQMLEVLREDYVRTARAKGLGFQLVLIRHALRNALLPVLTQFGGLMGVMITGVVVTETIFQVPGMGRAMVEAIGSRDYPIIQGLVLLNIAMVLIINLIVDLLYSVIDPRIRYA
ncbi:MAG: ABC transporter permease [Chloroflexota bacterium]|nr:ABC transporter permease [Chloroflexota bacterium]